MTYVIIALSCLFVGIFLGSRKPVSFMKPPKRTGTKTTLYANEDVFFVSPVNKEEAFKKSDSVDEFINKLK